MDKDKKSVILKINEDDKESLYQHIEDLSALFAQLIQEAPIENSQLMSQEIDKVSKHIRMTNQGLRYIP